MDLNMKDMLNEVIAADAEQLSGDDLRLLPNLDDDGMHLLKPSEATVNMQPTGATLDTADHDHGKSTFPASATSKKKKNDPLTKKPRISCGPKPLTKHQQPLVKGYRRHRQLRMSTTDSLMSLPPPPSSVMDSLVSLPKRPTKTTPSLESPLRTNTESESAFKRPLKQSKHKRNNPWKEAKPTPKSMPTTVFGSHSGKPSQTSKQRRNIDNSPAASLCIPAASMKSNDDPPKLPMKSNDVPIEHLTKSNDVPIKHLTKSNDVPIELPSHNNDTTSEQLDEMCLLNDELPPDDALAAGDTAPEGLDEMLNDEIPPDDVFTGNGKFTQNDCPTDDMFDPSEMPTAATSKKPAKAAAKKTAPKKKRGKFNSAGLKALGKKDLERATLVSANVFTKAQRNALPKKQCANLLGKVNIKPNTLVKLTHPREDLEAVAKHNNRMVIVTKLKSDYWFVEEDEPDLPSTFKSDICKIFYVIVDVKGNGNCGYYCLFIQLKRMGKIPDIHTITEFRKLIADYARANREELISKGVYYDSEHEGSFNTHIDQIHKKEDNFETNCSRDRWLNCAIVLPLVAYQFDVYAWCAVPTLPPLEPGTWHCYKDQQQDKFVAKWTKNEFVPPPAPALHDDTYRNTVSMIHIDRCHYVMPMRENSGN